MVKLLRETASLILSLSQTKTVLLSMEQQDPGSVELYRLLHLQNQLLLQRLCFLQGCLKSQSPATMSLVELQTLNQLAQVHCQIVGWLGGCDLNDAVKFDLPQDSTGSTVPALDFN